MVDSREDQVPLDVDFLVVVVLPSIVAVLLEFIDDGMKKISHRASHRPVGGSRFNPDEAMVQDSLTFGISLVLSMIRR